jgi:hypothetical protein
VFFITHLTGTSRRFRGISAKKKKSFDVLVQLKWAMKDALVSAPSFG